MSNLEVTHDWTADKWDWPMHNNDDFVNVRNTDDSFSVDLEVQEFRPEEIDVCLFSKIFREHNVTIPGRRYKKFAVSWGEYAGVLMQDVT